MVQQLCGGEIVPQSGIYRVTHAPTHVEAPCTTTFIRGSRFPMCPDCGATRFELIYSDEAVWRGAPHRRGHGWRHRRLGWIPVALLAALSRPPPIEHLQ